MPYPFTEVFIHLTISFCQFDLHHSPTQEWYLTDDILNIPEGKCDVYVQVIRASV